MSTVPEIMPVLSAGRHRTPRQGACFMEFASYLAGERWSDHPTCTHPLLASLARDVNDLMSQPARSALVPLIHRVIGLNTGNARVNASVTATIAMRAAAAAYPVASLERQRALAVGMLNLLTAAEPSTTLNSIAAHAFEQAPDGERWALDYLRRRPRAAQFDQRTAAAITHSAVVGIALACITDADSRLDELLTNAIVDVESLVHAHATEPATLVSA